MSGGMDFAQIYAKGCNCEGTLIQFQVLYSSLLPHKVFLDFFHNIVLDFRNDSFDNICQFYDSTL
jgi:hypothetical protein